MRIPESLASKLVEDALPWPNGAQIEIKTFVERYNLHDSSWLGLHIPCGWDASAVAAIRLDPIWNPAISRPTSVVDDWPLLFMRFSEVSSIQLSGFTDIGGLPRAISHVKVCPVSEKEVITTFTDHYGAAVTLRHFPLIDILFMSPAGELIGLSRDGKSSD